MSTPVQTRQQVIERLQQAETDLRRLGVDRLALFGSFRRDEGRADSDVDFLLGFVPGQKTFDRLLAIGDLLEGLLLRRVELVTEEALSPYLGPHIRAEAVGVL
jgi:uncharacterized protein